VEYFSVAVSLPDGRPVVQALEEIGRCVRQTVDEFKLALARHISF
jgi:hypothetical protein